MSPFKGAPLPDLVAPPPPVIPPLPGAFPLCSLPLLLHALLFLAFPFPGDREVIGQRDLCRAEGKFKIDCILRTGCVDKLNRVLVLVQLPPPCPLCLTHKGDGLTLEGAVP